MATASGGRGRPATRAPRVARRIATAHDSRTAPSTWAWLAEAWVAPDGSRAAAADRSALHLFVVSVNESYPTAKSDRLRLMRRCGEVIGERLVPGHSALAVYPAGCFGFDALRFREDPAKAWVNVERFADTDLQRVVEAHPSGVTLAFGADEGSERHEQRVLACGQGIEGRVEITRSRTPVSARTVHIGTHRVAFFACGEFVGSRTLANGPFDGTTFLDAPERDLKGCSLVVDLSHSRVPREESPVQSNHRAHQRQMERFARRTGAAALAHHHGGEMTASGSRKKNCLSDWIVFRGSRPERGWLDAEPIPVEET